MNTRLCLSPRFLSFRPSCRFSSPLPRLLLVLSPSRSSQIVLNSPPAPFRLTSPRVIPLSALCFRLMLITPTPHCAAWNRLRPDMQPPVRWSSVPSGSPNTPSIKLFFSGTIKVSMLFCYLTLLPDLQELLDGKILKTCGFECSFLHLKDPTGNCVQTRICVF